MSGHLLNVVAGEEAVERVRLRVGRRPPTAAGVWALLKGLLKAKTWGTSPCWTRPTEEHGPAEMR